MFNTDHPLGKTRGKKLVLEVVLKLDPLGRDRSRVLLKNYCASECVPAVSDVRLAPGQELFLFFAFQHAEFNLVVFADLPFGHGRFVLPLRVVRLPGQGFVHLLNQLVGRTLERKPDLGALALVVLQNEGHVVYLHNKISK